MNDKTESTDPEVAATLRALRRAAKRAMRLAKATGTPFWVMKKGRIVNLNPDAKGWRKMLRAATEAGKETKEPQARAKKAKKGSLKSGSRWSVLSWESAKIGEICGYNLCSLRALRG